MAQNRRFLLGDLGHIGKVCLDHGERVTVEIVVDAGAQILLAPVDFIIFAGLGAFDIVGAADPVVVLGRVVIAVQVPFQAAQNVQLTGIGALSAWRPAPCTGRCGSGSQYSRSWGVWLWPLKPSLQPGAPSGDCDLSLGVFCRRTIWNERWYRAFQVFASHSLLHPFLLDLAVDNVSFFELFGDVPQQKCPVRSSSTMTW